MEQSLAGLLSASLFKYGQTVKTIIGRNCKGKKTAFEEDFTYYELPAGLSVHSPLVSLSSEYHNIPPASERKTVEDLFCPNNPFII